MLRVLLFISVLLIAGCSSDSDRQTEKSPSAKGDHIPEIDIPGLGIDHGYVANELLEWGVNYRKVYSVTERDEILAKIEKLDQAEIPLNTEKDTMVVFSIHALKSTLYSRLSQSNPDNLRKIEEELMAAISLIEGKEKFKGDMAFEKLALTSLYFMQEEISKGADLSRDLIENYQEVSVPDQPMYISRNALVTYYQMISSYANYSNDRRHLDNLIPYVINISENHDDHLGLEADRVLSHYYLSQNDGDKAREINARVEERVEKLN